MLFPIATLRTSYNTFVIRAVCVFFRKRILVKCPSIILNNVIPSLRCAELLAFLIFVCLFHNNECNNRYFILVEQSRPILRWLHNEIVHVRDLGANNKTRSLQSRVLQIQYIISINLWYMFHGIYDIYINIRKTSYLHTLVFSLLTFTYLLNLKSNQK